MEKLEILEVLNDWNYWNRDLPKTISRDYYDKKINSFIKNDEIVVLKGIRRCGKSTLLVNQIKILCDEGIDKNDILGFSISNSFVIEKGFIIDIDEAYLSIKNSITEAKKNLPIDINRTIITLCSKDSLNIKIKGKINLPEKVITKREINQVLQTAQYNASIPHDYEMIQVIPKNFIVDNVSVINPLNSNADSQPT
jgi:energy-coupling factor transporter ATP-binding protein EcfA2